MIHFPSESEAKPRLMTRSTMDGRAVAPTVSLVDERAADELYEGVDVVDHQLLVISFVYPCPLAFTCCSC